VDVAKAAEVVVLVVPGSDAPGVTAVDDEGIMALSTLRALGLPELVVVAQSQPNTSTAAGAPTATSAAASVSMKARAAAKKRVAKAVSAVLAGEQRVLCGDSAADCGQLLRHLLERPAPSLPAWRQNRAALLVERAVTEPEEGTAAGTGTVRLRLTGYVRGAGLSANRLLTLPGAGDFQIEYIQQPDTPQAVLSPRGGVVNAEQGRSGGSGKQSAEGGDVDMGGGGGGAPIILAQVRVLRIGVVLYVQDHLVAVLHVFGCNW
jgi:pre-rRNA-processing protein TSR1